MLKTAQWYNRICSNDLLLERYKDNSLLSACCAAGIVLNTLSSLAVLLLGRPCETESKTENWDAELRRLWDEGGRWGWSHLQPGQLLDWYQPLALDQGPEHSSLSAPLASSCSPGLPFWPPLTRSSAFFPAPSVTPPCAPLPSQVVDFSVTSFPWFHVGLALFLLERRGTYCPSFALWTATCRYPPTRSSRSIWDTSTHLPWPVVLPPQMCDVASDGLCWWSWQDTSKALVTASLLTPTSCVYSDVLCLQSWQSSSEFSTIAPLLTPKGIRLDAPEWELSRDFR